LIIFFYDYNIIKITAPPSVTNLEVVETDTRQMQAMIHLRWQSPLPPLNGKLRNYDIQSRVSYNLGLASVPAYEDIQVQVNESCDLWDNYICKIVAIKLSLLSKITIKVK